MNMKKTIGQFGFEYTEDILGVCAGKTAILITFIFDYGFPAEIIRQGIKEFENEYEGTVVAFRIPWSKAVSFSSDSLA